MPNAVGERFAFTKAKNFAFMNQQPTFEIDFERM